MSSRFDINEKRFDAGSGQAALMKLGMDRDTASVLANQYRDTGTTGNAQFDVMLGSPQNLGIGSTAMTEAQLAESRRTSRGTGNFVKDFGGMYGDMVTGKKGLFGYAFALMTAYVAAGMSAGAAASAASAETGVSTAELATASTASAETGVSTAGAVEGGGIGVTGVTGSGGGMVGGTSTVAPEVVGVTGTNAGMTGSQVGVTSAGAGGAAGAGGWSQLYNNPSFVPAVMSLANTAMGYQNANNQASAAQQAAAVKAEQDKRAMQMQIDMYNRNAAMQAPWYNTGRQGINALGYMMGLNSTTPQPMTANQINQPQFAPMTAPQ